jgi:hypothetical protein
MHPGLFPGFFLDLFNPPRTRVTAEIDGDALSFISHKKSVPLASIEKVTIKHLSPGSQRLEILGKTLVRILVLTAFLSLCQLGSISRYSQPPVYSILIALAVATILGGPLFFLRNGGFKIKGSVVRLYFKLLGQDKPFYLEVEPEHEAGLSQVLLSAGLKFENKGKEETWECEKCGGIVSAEAKTCPSCGAKFDE